MKNNYCETVNISIQMLVDKFVSTYYTYEDRSVAEVYLIDKGDEKLHYNRDIGGDYWNIGDMYTALYYSIDKKILNKYLDIVGAINLENFYKLNKDNNGETTRTA